MSEIKNYTTADLLGVIAQQAKRMDEQATALNEAKSTTKVVSICGTILFSAFAIGGAIVFSTFPLEHFLYTDNAKAICEADTKKEPLVTVNTVIEFAKDCAIDIDTFGYDSVERDLTRMAERCLTPDFRSEFFSAPWLGERVDLVKNSLYRVSSQTTGPVLVQSSGFNQHGYMWRVEVPVKRIFKQGDSTKGTTEKVYVIDVYRVVKNAFNPTGLGINSIVERQAKAK